MLFHYNPEVGEFSYIKPDLQKTIEGKRREISEEAEDLEDFEILAEHVESLGKIPLVFCSHHPWHSHWPSQFDCVRRTRSRRGV